MSVVGLQACQAAIEGCEAEARRFKLSVEEAKKDPKVLQEAFRHLLQSGNPGFKQALEDVFVLVLESRASRNGEAEKVLETAQKRLDWEVVPIIENQLSGS